MPPAINETIKFDIHYVQLKPNKTKNTAKSIYKKELNAQQNEYQ